VTLSEANRRAMFANLNKRLESNQKGLTKAEHMPHSIDLATGRSIPPHEIARLERRRSFLIRKKTDLEQGKSIFKKDLTTSAQSLEEMGRHG